MSHKTASLIVATVPELPSVLLSAEEERPHDYNSRGGGREYSRATASEAQDWLIISLHGFPQLTSKQLWDPIFRTAVHLNRLDT